MARWEYIAATTCLVIALVVAALLAAQDSARAVTAVGLCPFGLFAAVGKMSD